MNKRSCLAVALWMVLAGLTAAPAAEQAEYEFEGGKWSAAPAAAEGTAEGELAIIRRDFEGGADRKVVAEAREYLKKYPDSSAREEAMMLAGLAQMDRGLYFQAYEWFEKQLAEFPAGRYSARALDCEYAIAEAFLGGKKQVVAGIFRISAKDEGVDILDRIPEHVPGSAIADKSLMRIGDYRLASGDYPGAAIAFDHYLSLFGKSRQAPAAMLKAANAAYASYGGAEYDDSPLLDAQQRFRRFSETFPLSARSANTQAVLTQIRNDQADKAFETARFYQRVGQPGAAAFYYRQVTDQFPDTDWAQQARTALAKLGSAAVAKPPAVRTAKPQVPARPAEPPQAEVLELEKLAPTTQEGGTNP